ncbi:helix-turn-helix domain-containing protein [Pararhizobium sp. LjRoot238]|uniref:helix-turn-helix domain-containing protein n=1 Tax=Pararhizobium sp. LjRoot238 TaxID=3342293 RepID=UPI003ECEB717
MEVFATNLRRRAQELGLANAEVARRVGLSERRYAHYVSGRNEPDLAMLLKIADVLQSSPNELLSGDEPQAKENRARLIDRLKAASEVMTEADLEVAVAQAEAVISLRRK